MSGDEVGRLIYLVVLVTAVGGSLVLSHRGSPGKLAQQMSVWGLIFVGVAAGYGLWSDISGGAPKMAVVNETGQIEVPQGPDGHYYLSLLVNGTPVNFMVDTGATEVVLSQRDAGRVGIDVGTLSFFGQASTANGPVRTARVTLEDVSFAGVDEGSLPAYVNEGQLDTSLLGMAYLRRFAKMEIAQGYLVLTR